MKSQLETKRQELTSKTSEDLTAIDQLNTEIKSLKELNETLKAEFETQKSSLEKNLQSIELEKFHLKDKVCKFETMSNSFALEKAVLNTSLETKRKELEESLTKIKTLQKEFHNLQSNQDMLQRQSREYFKNCEDFENELVSEKELVKVLKLEKESLTTDMQIFKIEIENLNAIKEKKISDLNVELNKANEQIKTHSKLPASIELAQFKKELLAIKDDNKLRKTQYKTLKSQLNLSEKCIEELKEAKSFLTERVEDLNKQIFEMTQKECKVLSNQRQNMCVLQ